MYPLAKIGRPVLHNDDINGIRFLYGPTRSITPVVGSQTYFEFFSVDVQCTKKSYRSLSFK